MAVIQEDILKTIDVTDYIAINATCFIYRLNLVTLSYAWLMLPTFLALK